MSFFEELYRGDVYPEEEIAESIATDQRYRELRNQISRLRERLCAEITVQAVSVGDCFHNGAERHNIVGG